MFANRSGKHGLVLPLRSSALAPYRLPASRSRLADQHAIGQRAQPGPQKVANSDRQQAGVAQRVSRSHQVPRVDIRPAVSSNRTARSSTARKAARRSEDKVEPRDVKDAMTVGVLK